jgi:hypothetical protein
MELVILTIVVPTLITAVVIQAWRDYRQEARHNDWLATQDRGKTRSPSPVDPGVSWTSDL